MKNSLNILFVTPYVPASVRIRPNGFLKYLCKKHRVTIVCFVHPAWEAAYLNELYNFCDNVYPVIPAKYETYTRALLGLPSRTPISIAICSSPKLKSIIRQQIIENKFDIIHTEFIRAAQYTCDIKNIPKVFDAVDSMKLAFQRAFHNPNSNLIIRALALEEWLKLKSYEPRMLRSFDHIVVSSPIDRNFLLIENGPEVEVIPNGIDLNYFQLDVSEHDENKLVFLGKMNYYVNVDSMVHFSKNILPQIQARRPKTKLTIVGWNPTRSIRSLESNPSITVTGGVPDVRPHLSNAAIFVAPLLSGAGIQNKVLQSMAIGTPIVATSLVCQGLGVNDGEHLLVADEPKEFSQAVLHLMDDKSLRNRLSNNARRYVEQNHDWNTICSQLENIYYKML